MKKEKIEMEKVEIPQRFREQLEERFNPDNAVLYKDIIGEWKIPISCPLCEEFDYNLCNKCPFKPFEEDNPRKAGCVVWMKKIWNERPVAFYIDDGQISWAEDQDEKARRQLRLFHKKAEKLIVWIETGGNENGR